MMTLLERINYFLIKLQGMVERNSTMLNVGWDCSAGHTQSSNSKNQEICRDDLKVECHLNGFRKLYIKFFTKGNLQIPY